MPMDQEVRVAVGCMCCRTMGLVRIAKSKINIENENDKSFQASQYNLF